jgi:hypothetical protein
VSECIITYDGVPSYSESIMQFANGSVVHETQYFANPFGAPEWRMELAEPMPSRAGPGLRKSLTWARKAGSLRTD